MKQRMMLYLEGMKLDKGRCFVKKNIPDKVLICLTVLGLFPCNLLVLYFKVFFSSNEESLKSYCLKRKKNEDKKNPAS